MGGKIRKEIVDLLLCMDVLAQLAGKSGPINEDEQKAIDALVIRLRELSHPRAADVPIGEEGRPRTST